MESDHQVRLANCLLGCALGDSLGLPREGLSAERAEKLFGPKLRQALFFGRGALSDDTHQSVLAFLACKRYPYNPGKAAAEFARLLRRWFFTFPPGIGLATVKSCLRLSVGIGAGRSGVYSAGNGAAMRSPIIGCLFADDAQKRGACVDALSRVTHTHPLAIQGAQIVADASAASCLGQLDLFLAEFERNYPDWPKDTGQPGNPSGYVVHSVNTVLEVIREHPNDLLGAIASAISKGGDTDTIAAMVGAIVGAGQDKIKIPSELANWIGWPSAGALSALVSQEGLHLNIGKIGVINAAAIPIVLAHGFRRLLPPY